MFDNDTAPLIAAHIRPGGVSSYAAWRSAVLSAEECGADIVLGNDHFHCPSVTGISADGKIELAPEQPDLNNFEGWTALASWAEITHRVGLGIMLSGAGFRNPDLLADMARTVDHISGGRVILGLGAGWYEKDYTSYGYKFGSVRSRQVLMRNSAARVKKRLKDLHPAPVGKIPLLMGGAGEKMTIPTVARYADIWHVPVHDVATFIRKRRILERELEHEDRRVDAVRLAVDWQGPAAADGYLAAGVTMFTVPLDPSPDYPLEGLQHAIKWSRNSG